MNTISYEEFFKLIDYGYGILTHGKSKISRLIQKITGSMWNHIVMSLKGFWIREAMWKGVIEARLEKYLKEGNELLVFKVKDASREEHVEAALHSRKYTGWAYGFLQLILIGCVRIWGKKHWWIRQLLLLQNTILKKHICSELYEQSWLDTGRDLTPGIDSAEVVPGHSDPHVNKLTQLIIHVRVVNGSLEIVEMAKERSVE